MTALVREFSALGPYQQAHTLTYAGSVGADGFCLSLRLDMEGRPARSETAVAAVDALRGRQLVRFLYENSIPIQTWKDVLDELLCAADDVVTENGRTK
ncbi:MAG: hypothetical protein IJ347_09860 [Faecalibacterium sp.]|nr:hypothetical protein [Faecalibacterium sp.]